MFVWYDEMYKDKNCVIILEGVDKFEYKMKDLKNVIDGCKVS